ncbi:hypothetical protein [Robertmurraya siralis]|uniref:hypothetical protein n=1 Tax=Robertmurraya siralis TaxID=77777 RepID=UPI0010F9FFAC|nr:hypothetical protein [Robertmurraya siralis]
MTLIEKQNILDVLNSLEVIESSGGDEAYILVENNKKNQELLNDVGIPSETINKYGDEETFCVLALAFGEGYCDLYDGGKLIAFDKSIEIEMKYGKSVMMYKHDGKFNLSIYTDGGDASIVELSDVQVKQIKELFE